MPYIFLSFKKKHVDGRSESVTEILEINHNVQDTDSLKETISKFLKRCEEEMEE